MEFRVQYLFHAIAECFLLEVSHAEKCKAMGLGGGGFKMRRLFFFQLQTVYKWYRDIKNLIKDIFASALFELSLGNLFFNFQLFFFRIDF